MKMTADQFLKAQEMRADGLSYEKISTVIGIPPSTLQYDLDPKIRKHIKCYREAHKAKSSQYGVKYRSTHEAEAKRYRMTYYKAHKVEIAQLTLRYRKNHSSEITAWNAARHALKVGALIGATTAQLAEIKEIYYRAKEDRKGRCYLCGKLIPKGHRHVDHIVPLSKGGAHRPSNLAVACDTCNLNKNNKLPEEIGILI